MLLPARLGKALDNFVEKLEAHQAEISEAYSAGVVSGYTAECPARKQLLATLHNSFGEVTFINTLPNS